LNPLPGQVVTDTSYQRNYPYNLYTLLPIAPELSYWSQKSGEPVPDATIFDTYQSFNASGLFNGKIFQDVFLSYMNANCSNVWTTPAFKNYLRFISVNFGLNGAFISASPREFIEGYTDPLLVTLNSMPVYEGGDQTRAPFIALNMPTTHPVDNPIQLMSGEDDA